MSDTSIKKVAILGASGLVAQETIKAFANADFQLRLFSRSIEAEKYPKHEVVKGDVFIDENLESAIKGCDTVHITLGQLDELKAVERIVKNRKKA